MTGDHQFESVFLEESHSHTIGDLREPVLGTIEAFMFTITWVNKEDKAEPFNFVQAS